MIYEVRTYTVAPGKRQALIERLTTTAFKLFAELGMDCIFLGVTQHDGAPADEIVYVMRFDSPDQLTEKWAAFTADPSWKQARAADAANGRQVLHTDSKIVAALP